MSLHLSPEDCHAIDLLLDQGVRAKGQHDGQAITSSAAAIAQDRLAAVQRVLGLLELMPLPEPPANLVSKTLSRCERAPRNAAHAVPTALRGHRDQPLA